MVPHQFIDRESGRVVTEALLGDRLVGWLYGPLREKAPQMFRALTSAHGSRLLSYLNFDCPARHSQSTARRLVASLGIDLRECLAPALCLASARSLFERQIRYWRCRPTPGDPASVVSPADAKIIVGCLDETDHFFLKEKFFTYAELLGPGPHAWQEAFAHGAFAVLRLTPEKYHYNHAPVAGRVVDFYALEGEYHSCNPAAVVAAVRPYSKNKRVVTIIDTDVDGGTGVGLVAMVEIVALMIGEIVQCYSADRYEAPAEMRSGMMLLRGQPKSLFRPGSSVVVLFFQKERIVFDRDLIDNRRRMDAVSRFSLGFREQLVETDVRVRSSVARRRAAMVATQDNEYPLPRHSAGSERK